jgi:hypothetical protein
MSKHLCRLAVLAIGGLAFGLVACSANAPSTAGQPDIPQSSLKGRLAQLTGSYAFRDDLDAFHYSEKQKIEEVLSTEAREAAVAALVDCLDDTTPSESSLDGRHVAVGIVCYEALTQLVYHEPTLPIGDVAATWPGAITPRASTEAMQAAKEAWRGVVATRAYVFQ